jgi:hypothetical protein
MAGVYVQPRVPSEQPFLNKDGTVSRAWIGFFNSLSRLAVLGPANTSVTDNTDVKWDGTSGRLVK